MNMMQEINLASADLNLFVVFEAVLRERHLARAAKHLALSPSAVSHAVARLRGLLNDPVFVKTPKGVVPTARALALAEPIAEILSRTRQVVGSADPFDPKRAHRRFLVGMQDGVAPAMLPPLLGLMEREGPFIDLGITASMPYTAFEDLDAHRIDLAVQPTVEDPPPRFVSKKLYVAQFVIAVRRGHRLARKFSLDAYCAESHVVVSQTGDPSGVVDIELAKLGKKRRVALAVPNFMLALATVAESNLVAAVPRGLVEAHAARFAIKVLPAPSPWGRADIRVIAPKSAMMDEGLAWMFDAVRRAAADLA